MPTPSTPSLLRRAYERLLALVPVQPLPANPYPPLHLRRFFWHFVGQHKGILATLLVLNILGAGSLALTPVFTGQIVDALATAGPLRTWQSLWQAIATPALLYIGIALLLKVFAESAFNIVEATTIASGTPHVYRRQLHWYLLQHGVAYFQNDFAGRLANKVMDAGSALRNISRKFVSSFLWVGTTFIITTVTLVQSSTWYLLPLALFLGGIGFSVRLLSPRIHHRSRVFSETRSAVVGRLVDTYTNISTVKLFAASGHEDNYSSGMMTEARRQHARLNITSAALDICVTAITALFSFGVLVISMHLYLQGQATPGSIAAALALALMLSNQAHWITGELMMLFEDLGTLSDDMHTLIKPFSTTDAPTAPVLASPRAGISFTDVSFSYQAAQSSTPENTCGDHASSLPTVITGLNLHIPAGQKVGLVGPSGAGKSTLVNLLLRFFDVTGGTIALNVPTDTADAHHDIKTITQESLRRHISMVTQDTSLLHRTIMENIRYGRPDASDHEVFQAARLAHAHDFILGLSDKDNNTGYAARVGERGVKLSGGQRQRIAIARLILKDAPILVLDEATSALDSEVEQVIQQNLMTLMEGKTVIAIAHRLSTIAMLDRILVLDGGRIVEDGTHRELLARGGTYARLWQRQSGGFLPD